MDFHLALMLESSWKTALKASSEYFYICHIDDFVYFTLLLYILSHSDVCCGDSALWFDDFFLFKNPHMVLKSCSSSLKQKASFVVQSFDIFLQNPLSLYLFLQSVSGAELKTNSSTCCLGRRDSAGGPTHLVLLAELRRTFLEHFQRQRALQQTGESGGGAAVG